MHNTLRNKLKEHKLSERSVVMEYEVLKGFIPNVLLFVSFSLILLSRTDQNMVHICIFIQTFVAAITHFYLNTRLRHFRIYNKLLMFLLICGVVLFLNLMLVGNITLKMIIYAVIIMPSIAMLIFFGKIQTSWLYAIFFFALAFIVIRWWLVGDPNIVTVNSRNYLGTYLVLYSLPYYFNCYKNRILPNLALPLITLTVSILAVGRGGILVSLIILIGWLFEYHDHSKHKYIVVGFIIMLGLGMIVTISSTGVVNKYFSRFEAEGFFSSIRAGLYAEYLNSLMVIRNFFLGTNLDSLPLIAFRGSSVHNSYLYAHARMGIFSFIYVYYIAKGFFTLFREKSWFFVFYFMAVLIKAFIDSDFPATPVGADIYVFFLILVYMSYKEEKNNRQKES